jgi:hypothetical protein
MRYLQIKTGKLNLRNMKISFNPLKRELQFGLKLMSVIRNGLVL